MRDVPKQIKDAQSKLDVFNTVNPIVLKNLGYLTKKNYYAGPPGTNYSQYVIQEDKVESYFDNINYKISFDIWSKFHLNMGFPFSGGWAEQPYWVSDIIHLFEGIYNEEQAAKSKSSQNKSKLNGSNNNSGINTKLDKAQSLYGNK